MSANKTNYDGWQSAITRIESVQLLKVQLAELGGVAFAISFSAQSIGKIERQKKTFVWCTTVWDVKYLSTFVTFLAMLRESQCMRGQLKLSWKL